MPQNAVDEVTEIISNAPHAAQSLLLFALVKTLDIEKGGHMYMLAKLRELTPEHRQLAYRLMEAMANGETRQPSWREQVDAMEAAIRNA